MGETLKKALPKGPPTIGKKTPKTKMTRTSLPMVHFYAKHVLYWVGPLDCRKLTADDIVTHTKRHPVTLHYIIYTAHRRFRERNGEGTV